MAMSIEDGAGTGLKAQVDSNNRLRTATISEPEIDHAAASADRYNINTGIINLTSTAESAIIYVKNNENKDLIINALIYNLDRAVGGSGAALIDVYRNPLSGTIVSTGSAVDTVSNMNFGSNKTLTIDAFKGDQALTQTGGDFSIGSIVTPPARAVVSLGSVVVPKGSSLAVTITPPPGNTAMRVNAAAAVFLKTDSVSGE